MQKIFLKQLLSSINFSQVDEYPYPFFTINNIFEKSLYNNITNNFPKNLIHFNNAELNKNNYRINFNINSIETSDIFYNDWNKIFDFITSKNFFDIIINKFNKQIKKYYPFLEPENLKIGRENYDTFEEKDILLNCHFGINTPVKIKSTVRGAHFDDTQVLYQGLIYFKEENDNSIGGNFCIFKKKDSTVFIESGRLVSNDQIELTNEIPYVGNNMVCFLNTKSSIHGVSKKDCSEYYRRFITFNAVYSDKLFNLKSKKLSLFRRILNKFT